MIIHRLTVSGFKIMGDYLDLSFPENGRIGIYGYNECGKSTLLEAIEYALYGLKKGSKAGEQREDIVTWGKQEAKFEIEFSSGANQYLLNRTIGSKGAHKALLTQVIQGTKDKKNAITSLKEIETKVEQITGMDRDSFTKLTYVKQKDLDALKELVRSKREQLINKVMGIEIFDVAADKAKADDKEIESKIKFQEEKLRIVGQNVNRYKELLENKKELDEKIGNLEIELKNKDKELEEAKKNLDKYDWLKSFNFASKTILSLEQQYNSIEKRLGEAKKLEEKVKVYYSTLDKFSPEVSKLETYQSDFDKVENELVEAREKASSLEKMKHDELTKAGIPETDLKKDFHKSKSQELKKFFILLFVGLGILFAGFLNSPFFIIIGIFLILISALFFRRYTRIDNLLNSKSMIDSYIRQSDEQQQTVKTLEKDLSNLKKGSGYLSSEDAKQKLLEINTQIKNLTEQTSIQGLDAVTRQAEKDLNGLNKTEIEKELSQLKNKKDLEKQELEKLELNKPSDFEQVEYNDEIHKEIKESFEKLNLEYNKINQDIERFKGSIKVLEEQLVELKPDFDSYPSLTDDFKNMQQNLDVLNRVVQELAETSKGLRNSVIPNARFIINDILPRLTNGRYSDFEITEDLKFTVHSNDAGCYKEREVFSGGTQDQFLIALRLAFTQSILDSRVMADRYCLLMDECIASSDDSRKQGIFDVLEVVKNTFPQIFIIAHEDISNLVDYYLVLERNDKGYSRIKSKSW